MGSMSELTVFMKSILFLPRRRAYIRSGKSGSSKYLPHVMYLSRIFRLSPHLYPKHAPSFLRIHRPLSTTQPRQSTDTNDKPPQPPSPQNRLTALKHRILSSPYSKLMRLDKPTGTNLLFLPAAWSITLTATPLESLQLLPIFYLGATILRGAGCTANDILDADVDAKVTRTKTRPIPAGTITQSRAILFLTGQLSAGLVVLTQLNTTAFLVGSLAVIPAMFYPLAKRRLPHPQAVLALTFNSGALLGYAAVTDSLALPAFLLHGAGCCWTMVYDTLYAHQDVRDDRVIGIGSSALTFGDRTKPALTAFIAGKTAFLAATGVACGLADPFFMGVAASSVYLLNLVYRTDLANPEQCAKAFRKSANAGGIVWASIAAGRLFVA